MMTVEELIQQEQMDGSKRIEFIFADRDYANLNIPADSMFLDEIEYSTDPFRKQLKEFEVIYWTKDCHFDDGKKRTDADYMIIVREYASKIRWTDKDGYNRNAWFDEMDKVKPIA